MISEGDFIKITAGSRTHGIDRGEVYTVERVRENGPDYGHTVTLTLRRPLGGAANKIHYVEVRHKNRLGDPVTHGHKGDPTKRISFTKVVTA